MTGRPPFVLDLPSFQGPVDVLHDEVTRGARQIEQLELAAVTAAFGSYLAAGDVVDLDEAGSFLQLASRLALMKSVALLPRAEAREEEQFVASATPTRLIDPLDVAIAVERLQSSQGVEMYPGESRLARFPRAQGSRSVSTLRRAWRDLENRVAAQRVRVAPPAFVRLEVAVSRLIRRVKTVSRLSFRSLLQSSSKNEAVVHFLAVLELVRRGRVTAVQQGLFGEIVIEPVHGDAESDVRAG